MKKFIIAVLCFVCRNEAMAQTEKSTAPKNIIKINILALAAKNLTIQYERTVGKRVSVAALARMMPKSSIPLKSYFENTTNDPDTKKQIDNIRVGNFAFTPEARYYVGRKGALHGFYIGGFATLANYAAELPYQYTDMGATKTIPMSGNLTSITGGILFGSQWMMGKRLSLDWWILGLHYGSGNGKISGQSPLTLSEQNSLKQAFDDIDIPLTKISYTVDANGATLFFKGPWGGIRSGLCLGFSF